MAVIIPIHAESVRESVIAIVIPIKSVHIPKKRGLRARGMVKASLYKRALDAR
jgi:hypothetical protein